jgi:hypothetical protein
MKVAITGHTSGVGEFLYKKFAQSHTVIGFSRSNGYAIENNFSFIVDEIKKVDFFINNACYKDYQTKLFREVAGYNKHIVCMGSQGRKYPHILNKVYSENKQNLYQEMENYMSTTSANPCLHLDIGFLENKKTNISSISNPFYTTYQEIYETIVFWLNNPCFFNIEFNTHLDNDTLQQIIEFNET